MGLERSVADSFEQSGELGEFRGERADLPVSRLVTDAEGVLSADNGALRIAPLIESGWGRVGLAYGPFPREAGLALAVYMLNGHNTAQAENLPESLWQRLDRWCLGSNATGRRQRLRYWWASGRVRRTARLFRCDYAAEGTCGGSTTISRSAGSPTPRRSIRHATAMHS
jgi:hypothetical protein